ncbi:MAG: replication-associated recombination protein A [Pseudomonadota bacterium]|nr:replication-associated recombination protein A [Syntrophaceae bacterium]MDI9555584.1 replication-associated recombination protein A [Pseudomonadota bacterium]NLX30961.1 replication-associated recombination protein A [Deltaproteobacteria bacterium]HNU85167.1 replication-associated recombination protein A [Syntrophales bacterium]HNZ34134.1 replication-associated recombination protein A [Syntrophales bacterium]
MDSSDERLSNARPLADRMRPETLEEYVGQSHVLDKGGLLRKAIEEDRLFSMIFWGPPGSGKTTLARLIAGETKSHFATFSAVLSGVKEIRAVIDEARSELETTGRRTILFVDEIHRFNKAQQDAFLPHVESGLITLIGATTENPSFEVISPLLSRTRVIVLRPFTEEELAEILRRALADPVRGLGGLSIEVEPEALDHLVRAADGDARSALNNLEAAASLVAGKDPGERTITLTMAETALQRKALQYDRAGEEHYNLISALHKSLRGSDPDAALYWLARMLEAGEDPLYVARRMIRFASEDIGNADPMALQVAMAAMQAFHFIGRPEGELSLAQAATYLATAPKSNAIYRAYGMVKSVIGETGTLPVPLHIRNAPTRLTRELGYGKGYRYAHDYKEAIVPQDHLPERLRGQVYYSPTDRGYEKIIRERLTKWRRIREQAARDGKQGQEE